MPGSGEWLDKNANSWISEEKQYEETMANERSQNVRGENQMDEITYPIVGLLYMHTYAFKGEGGWKIGHKIRTY